jgi:hypothetical protein
MSTSSMAESSTRTEAPPRDWRGFWRVLLAVVAPIPGVALALSNGLNPSELGGSTRETFEEFAAHQTQAQLSLWFGVVFAILAVPSGVAMLMATRRVVPRLSTFIVGFVTFGFCAGVTAPNVVNNIALETAQNNLDPQMGIAIADEVFNSPFTNVAILPFFLTITIGRVLLGIVLWRAQIAPRWMAVAMLLASPVEFLLVGPVGNVGPTVAYALTAIGFASASVALLRMTNDEFDVPPLTRAASR